MPISHNTSLSAQYHNKGLATREKIKQTEGALQKIKGKIEALSEEAKKEGRKINNIQKIDNHYRRQRLERPKEFSHETIKKDINTCIKIKKELEEKILALTNSLKKKSAQLRKLKEDLEENKEIIQSCVNFFKKHPGKRREIEEKIEQARKKLRYEKVYSKKAGRYLDDIYYEKTRTKKLDELENILDEIIGHNFENYPESENSINEFLFSNTEEIKDLTRKQNKAEDVLKKFDLINDEIIDLLGTIHTEALKSLDTSSAIDAMIKILEYNFEISPLNKKDVEIFLREIVEEPPSLQHERPSCRN